MSLTFGLTLTRVWLNYWCWLRNTRKEQVENPWTSHRGGANSFNRQLIKKQRHHSANIVNIVKAMVFPVVMYRCDSWTIKKPEHQRIDAKRSNQSILKEINSEYSLEGLMLKLKLQYFATWCEDLTHWKGPWCWERMKAGGEGEDRKQDGWMASPT